MTLKLSSLNSVMALVAMTTLGVTGAALASDDHGRYSSDQRYAQNESERGHAEYRDDEREDHRDNDHRSNERDDDDEHRKGEHHKVGERERGEHQ